MIKCNIKFSYIVIQCSIGKKKSLVICTRCGTSLVDFSGFGHTSNVDAELLAIDQGLLLAWNSGFTPIICEADSMTALHLNTKEDSTLPSLRCSG